MNKLVNKNRTEGDVVIITAEDRLRKIRSIIHFVEEKMQNPKCDQLSLLREAILDISMAAGPPMCGKKR